MSWLNDVTDELWANKLAKRFNTLADVFLFLLSVAHMNGVDLERAVAEKMGVNVSRHYVHDAVTGQPVKVEAVAVRG